MSQADDAACAVAAGDVSGARQRARLVQQLGDDRCLMYFPDGSALLVDGADPVPVNDSSARRLLGEMAAAYAAAHATLVQVVSQAAAAAKAAAGAGVSTDEIADVLGLDWVSVYRWTVA